ncbi:hypothetical protein TL16_g00069 [Triparma laevis f. inornata]|uniref:WW domain-containing protein n=1 Tax=Triparma laevis f. inornata TaxID=1714386 RepID=A0A9W7DMB2_9STRA|nr:hypothetical protein TL16_g00069 [Triparma laevis f. inornata]
MSPSQSKTCEKLSIENHCTPVCSTVIAGKKVQNPCFESSARLAGLPRWQVFQSVIGSFTAGASFGPSGLEFFLIPDQNSEGGEGGESYLLCAATGKATTAPTDKDPPPPLIYDPTSINGEMVSAAVKVGSNNNTDANVSEWHLAVDANSGKTYYYTTEGETRWDKPEESPAPAPVPAPAPASQQDRTLEAMMSQLL